MKQKKNRRRDREYRTMLYHYVLEDRKMKKKMEMADERFFFFKRICVSIFFEQYILSIFSLSFFFFFIYIYHVEFQTRG